MKYIGNEELNKLAEKYADERAIENDTKNLMQIRGSYRAGFFAALKILRTAQPTESDKSDEQPCFKHDVIVSLLERAAGLVGHPCTNISYGTDASCEQWQKDYEHWRSGLKRPTV